MDTTAITAFASTAILGSGLMGVGIALHLARYGHHVRLYDPQPERLAEIPTVANAILSELAAAGQFEESDKDATLSRLLPVSTLRALADADLLIEAIPERLPLKQSLYRELETIVRPDCVFASNTAVFRRTVSPKVSSTPNGCSSHTSGTLRTSFRSWNWCLAPPLIRIGWKHCV